MAMRRRADSAPIKFGASVAALAFATEEAMDRRWLMKVFSAGLVTLPIVDRAAAYEKSSEKHHKLALHVDVNDPEVMKLAFNNARNAHELYKEWGEDLAVEIVAYSQGLHMLRDDTSPVKAEIKALREKVPQVAFGACNNTKTGMEKREGKTIVLIPEATLVPAGIVRLVELQELGFKYVKP
jgi:uncharacterized protein